MLLIDYSKTKKLVHEIDGAPKIDAYITNTK